MKLMLKQLQTLARQTLEETRALDAFRIAVRAAFGPSVLVEGSVSDIARQVNHYLDSTCKTQTPTVKVSTLVRYVRHEDPEVRKMTARLLPERFCLKLKDDVDPTVRAAVARRAPAAVLFEMCKRHPDDDQLRVIRKERVINEALDLDAAAKLSAASQKRVVVDLSDDWYKEAARKVLNDYGEFTYGTPRPLEHHWNPLAVRMFCDATRVSSGITIDCKKLQDAVDEMVTALESGDPLYKGTLNDLLKNLTETVRRETQPVVKLEDEKEEETFKGSSSEFVKKFEEVYEVKKTNLPAAICKYRVGDALDTTALVPMKVRVGSLSESTEKSLDKYVKSWNDMQSLRGEPLKIDWAVDPTDCECVSFELELK